MQVKMYYMWKGRMEVGRPAACEATAMVYAPLQGTSLRLLGLVPVLRGAVSRVRVGVLIQSPRSPPESPLVSESCEM